MRKRLLSLLLVLSMVFAVLPIMSNKVNAASQYTVTVHIGDGVKSVSYSNKEYTEGDTFVVSAGAQVRFFVNLSNYTDYVVGDVYTTPACTVSNNGSIGRIITMPNEDIDLYANAKENTNLVGQVSITGDAKSGSELTAVVSNSNTSNLNYTWTNAKGDVVSTTNKYTAQAADVGNSIKVTVTSPDANRKGNLTSSVTIKGDSHKVDFVIKGDGNVEYLREVYTESFGATAEYGLKVQFFLDNGVQAKITSSDTNTKIISNGTRGYDFTMPDQDITITIDFVMMETDLAKADITFTTTEVIYSGENVNLDLTVKLNDEKLIKESSYRIQYLEGDGKNAGKQTFVVVPGMISVYEGQSEELSYVIKPYEDVQAEIDCNEYVYTGSDIFPDVNVFSGLSLEMIEGTDYVIEYPSVASEAGTYTIVVEFKGNYEGTISIDYTIVIPESEWINTDGKWMYKHGDGSYTVSDWELIDGIRYHFDAEGYRQTGWQLIDSVWYYFNEDGVIQTGWQRIGSTWYYLDTDGIMQTGWQKIGSTWYYFSTDGAMQTGWQRIGNIWYYFNADGAMQTGWQRIGSTWYYFNANGAMQTGWQKLGNTWYYFNTSGAMLTDWQKIGSSWYYFNASGAMQSAKWIGNYYLDNNGAMVTYAYIKDGTKYYWVNRDGLYTGTYAQKDTKGYKIYNQATGKVIS